MRWLVLGLGLLAACGDTLTFVAQKGVDEWKQSPTDQVDILWVVDNSNSMQLEQSLLGAGFASFAQELENTNTNFHIGVVTTSFEYDDPDRGKLVSGVNCGPIIDKDLTCPNPDNPSETWDYVNVFTDRAQVGLNGSGKEKGLEVALYALSPAMTTGPNAGFLRDEANLLVIIVSDEEDCSDNGRLATLEPTACYDRPELLTPVGEFVNAFSGLKPSRSQFQLSAIVGPENATSICDDTSITGKRYIDVAAATGGVTSSICETDWSGILYELGLNAAGIYTTFEMEHGAVDGTLVVTIDGEVVPVSEIDGYTYDDTTYTITFHGIYVPERGATIVAKYDIQSGT
jgi:hypothetical protein